MYCTLEDLKLAIDEARLLELTDDEGLGVINQARIDAAIGDAQGEVDGWLQERYDVPLDPVPALIKRACIDVAIPNLYSRKVETLPDVRVKRYDNAIKLLARIADGKLSLGIAVQPEETNSGKVLVTASTRIFPDTELDKF
jgi:phage gp36-like protein